jgi:hypothetical protein
MLHQNLFIDLRFSLCNYGSSMHTLDHAESESEVQAEQAQVESSINLVLV